MDSGLLEDFYNKHLDENKNNRYSLWELFLKNYLNANEAVYIYDISRTKKSFQQEIEDRVINAMKLIRKKYE